MAIVFKKLNKEPLVIEHVPDEHEEENDFKASFWWNNKRYFLDDFIRTHNNPWVNDDFPEYIHGMESEQYVRPLLIELIGDEAVNVYVEKEEDTEEKKFDTEKFFSYMEDEFPEAFKGTHGSYLRELVANVVKYGIDHKTTSKDSLVYFLSDILPEIEPAEAAQFADDSILTAGMIWGKEQFYNNGRTE